MNCDICKKQVGNQSVDIMISVIFFDENGDPVKTMEPIHLEPEHDQDYVTVCTGCEVKVKQLWYRFLDSLDR